MLYTILGGLIGYIGSYFITKILGTKTTHPSGFVSPRSIIVFFCTCIGAFLGFGYGAGLLINGNHFFNKIKISISD